MNYLDDFVAILVKIKDEKLLRDFLDGILTEKELKEIPLRLEIVKRLLNGEAQHKIALELGVGVGTVSRGSKEIKNGRFKVLKK